MRHFSQNNGALSAEVPYWFDEWVGWRGGREMGYGGFGGAEFVDFSGILAETHRLQLSICFSLNIRV